MDKKPMRVLCVEDNSGDALLLRRMLDHSSVPVELVCVERFADARARLEKETFDVTLLDLSLPDAQGFETVKRMRAVAPGVPIVILTGLMDESVGIQCVQAGAQDYLVKGKIDEALLTRVLAYAVERQRAEQEIIDHREHLQELVRARTVELAEARDVALESARLKAEFMSNMSHEIRTPMNAVIGMTELLMATDMTPTQRNYGKVVQSAGEALLRIINDILDFSKMESGKLILETEDFHFPTAIEDVVELLNHQAKPKGIRLSSEVQSGIPECLSGDVGRLQQVLINLAGNAIKFTEKGEVTIRVAMERETERQVVIRFRISDTGIGLSEEGKKHLFQSFSQADTSIRRKFGGTGLGLAISKKIVELMSGDMGVESALGEGSTFWFTVPFEKGLKDAASFSMAPLAPASVKPAQSRAREGIRILVADDNEFNRTLAQEQLATLGYEAEMVANGANALQALDRSTYSIVLMDCQMPELDGYQATTEIRKREAGGAARTIVIAMTANVLEKDQKKCLEAGMDDYLAKPVKIANLKSVLDRWMPQPADNATPSAAAPAPAEGKDNPVDLKVLQDATEGNEQALARLKSAYFDQAEGNLKRLEDAIHAGTAKEIARVAHCLAGSSVCFGAAAMVAPLREIERNAEDQQLKNAPALFQKVLVEYDRVRKFMAIFC